MVDATSEGFSADQRAGKPRIQSGTTQGLPDYGDQQRSNTPTRVAANTGR